MAPSVAFTGVVSVTVKVSSGSTAASLMIGTEIVFFVSPGANVSVPEVAV